MTTNVNVEMMYTMCDGYFNQYLILDNLLNYHNNEYGFSLENNNISVNSKPSIFHTTVG